MLLRMRKVLREREFVSAEVSDDEEASCFGSQHTAEVSGLWKKWDSISPEEVIQDSILNGTVPIAQSYFSCHCHDNKRSSYRIFEDASTSMVLKCLRKGSMQEGLDILLNMGYDSNSKLVELLKSTSEKDVRTLLLKELQNRNLLTDQDKQSLQFVSLLEQLFPCSSFEHARLLLDEKSALAENMTCAVPESKNTLAVGDFMEFSEETNSESSAYCRIVLSWLSAWDSDTKGRILAPHYLKNSPVLEYFTREDCTCSVDKISVWYYLLESGNIPYLMNWIDVWLGFQPQNSDGFSTLDAWPINQEMINAIPEKATLHVAETLLDALARHGIFCDEELENISLFLTRIGHSQCDINEMSIFGSEKASIPFPELCHRLVHYCLKHNLVHFLYMFVSKNFDKFSEWPSCKLCDVPLLNLIKDYHLWSQNHNDSQLAYKAISGTAKLVYNLQSTSSDEILSSLPVPLSMAILLLKPQDLTKSVQESIQSSKDAVGSIKEKFKEFPLLFDHLFKSIEERSAPDITVYELLKGSTIFDTTQLFGWQKANTFKSEDSQSELPHFSLKSLSEQYGLKKELTYLYYLAEGRPNYAYLKYIAREVVLETGLTLSRVRATCHEVTDCALRKYKDCSVASSCITFLELLGQDSLPLRVCLVAANMLHPPGMERSSPEIARKFRQAHADKDAAIKLTQELESIILQSWNPYNTDSNALIKDIMLWMPVMMLSHLFETESGSAFLLECAKQNKWLEFLVFSQVFQNPKEQVLKAASRFSDSCISYHIFHSLHRKSSLLHDVAYASRNVLSIKTQKKDMRKSLYSRIGLVKGSPPSPEIKKSPEQEEDRVSVTSEDTSTSSDVDLRSFVLKDLFSQLLLAHSSDAPWDCLLHTSYEIQNPILAMLAASYPESSLVSCFFMWLYTSLSQTDRVQKALESTFPELNINSCSTDDLEKLVVMAVQNHKILTLWHGVHFFLPTTPLPSLLGYLRSFLLYKKFDSSIESYQNQLWDYPKIPEKPTVLHSLLWIENVSVLILKEAVISCSTSYERLVMLRHFSHTRLEKSFSKEVRVPQFMKVYKMMESLNDAVHDTNVNDLFLPDSSPSYKDTCWGAVMKLLKGHFYAEAQSFSLAADLPQDQMMLLQLNHESDVARSESRWSSLSNRIDFWRRILERMKTLPVQSTISFLEGQIELSEAYGEKYFLLKNVAEILSVNKDHSAALEYNLESLNRKMWWWCIKAEVNKELSPQIFDVQSVHELNVQELLDEPRIQPSSHCIETEKEKEALETIIEQFLMKKDVARAFQLASTFNFKCNDLKIIKMCLEIAKNEISILEIDLNLPDYVQDFATSRYIRALLNWALNGKNGISASDKETIKCLEKLCKKCRVATVICHQILVQYIIASVLNVPYISIATETDIFSILKQILVKRLKDEHVLAKSLIVVCELPDTDIARFLSEEIWRSLQMLSISDLVMLPEEKSAFSEQVIYDPLQAKERFPLIVKLCQDPAILGNALLKIVSLESNELTSRSTDENFYAVVDMCISAHECFSASCHMDGISHILHTAQTLVTLLKEAEKFSIMAHLLTGLGRYSEMMYVFDILKSSEKLNLLFDKRMENMPDLRLALLDYLKRCPVSEGDKYFFSLAEKSGMHREKAEILEMSVQKKLSLLCKKNTALDNNLTKDLESALDELSEAATSYCKAECLHQAQNCTRLAQLVALQVYFVPSGVWIVGLDDVSVARFITDHDKFSQAYIVAEEYGNHRLWSQAVFNNVVMRGDKEYLQEFQAHFGLHVSLITDIVKRFQKVANKTENNLRNMKILLSQCTNIKAKYCLAQELGFSDMVSQLLMGEGSSFLRDLIANNIIK